jgi:hypothetical protein
MIFSLFRTPSRPAAGIFLFTRIHSASLKNFAASSGAVGLM